MSETLTKADAFAGEDLSLDGAKLRPAPSAAKFILRANAGSAARVGAAFGVSPPMAPLRFARDAAGRRAVWLGPDEWLLLAPGVDASRLRAELAQAVGGEEGPSHALFDVTNRQVGFTLEGPQAMRILTGGCPLDLNLSTFPVGSAARTLYVKAEITLMRDAEDAFHVETLRSFLPYLLAHLRHAARGAPR
jgi:sarcosine oxidase subunit gamma